MIKIEFCWCCGIPLFRFLANFILNFYYANHIYISKTMGLNISAIWKL